MKQLVMAAMMAVGLAAMADVRNLGPGDWETLGGWKAEGAALVNSKSGENAQVVITIWAGPGYCWAKALVGSDCAVKVDCSVMKVDAKGEAGKYVWTKLGNSNTPAGYTAVELIQASDRPSGIEQVVITDDPNWKPEGYGAPACAECPKAAESAAAKPAGCCSAK